MGNFGIKFIYFNFSDFFEKLWATLAYIFFYYFAEFFGKIFSSIVENSKNLDRKNLESNPNLVPKISKLVMNTLTTRNNKKDAEIELEFNI